MKTNLNVLLIFILLSTISLPTYCQWTDITPTDTSFGFGRISFADNNNGYIAGNTNDKLFKTTDGGTTWSTLIVDSTLITDVHFISPTTGFVTGNRSFSPSKYNVSKTTDGGATWIPINPDLNQTYTHVFFKDANTGFVTAQWGSTYKTTNSGTSWTKVDSSGGNDVQDKGFYNSSTDTAYLVGWDGTFAYQGLISKTTNNGNSWSVIMPFGWNSAISNIHMVNNQSGYIIKGLWGSTNGNYIYKTIDGFTSLDSVLKPTLDIYDIYFISMNEGYLLADSGVYKTTDGLNFSKELSFTNGQSMGRFEKAGNTLFLTTGSRVYKRSIGTGINSQSGYEQYKIYPNPAKAFVNVVSEQEGLVSIYSITGKLVKRELKTAEKIEINIRNLVMGVYFIEFEGVVEKLIIN